MLCVNQDGNLIHIYKRRNRPSLLQFFGLIASLHILNVKIYLLNSSSARFVSKSKMCTHSLKSKLKDWLNCLKNMKSHRFLSRFGMNRFVKHIYRSLIIWLNQRQAKIEACCSYQFGHRRTIGRFYLHTEKLLEHFIKRFLVLDPYFINDSEVPCVFDGFAKFSSLALYVDFRNE